MLVATGDHDPGAVVSQAPGDDSAEARCRPRDDGDLPVQVVAPCTDPHRRRAAGHHRLAFAWHGHAHGTTVRQCVHHRRGRRRAAAPLDGRKGATLACVTPGRGDDGHAQAGSGDEGPLADVRILAVEQMQAIPYATQLLAHLGADVVKIEDPVHGESGRASRPAVRDADGRDVGATYLRNNLGKRSLTLDIRSAEGRDLFLRLAPHFDVIAENFKPGTTDKLGIGYDDVRRVHPSVVYVSVSGFGSSTDSPYSAWPAYAATVEAMSGLYEANRLADERPRVGSAGPLGDISSAVFAALGTLVALRQPRPHR